jgi:hypothetical protein
MKDALDQELTVGDKVLYITGERNTNFRLAIYLGTEEYDTWSRYGKVKSTEHRFKVASTGYLHGGQGSVRYIDYNPHYERLMQLLKLTPEAISYLEEQQIRY